MQVLKTWAQIQMNIEIALKIFSLGVKFGAHQSSLGLEPAKMSDERLAEILHQGFKDNIDEIEKYSQDLIAQKVQAQWYAQNWTCKQAFRFGLLSGFDEYPKIMSGKKGEKILTEDVIDKLTQLQFRSCKPFGED